VKIPLRPARVLPGALASFAASAGVAGGRGEPPVIDTGDTAWVLAASALVLMMTLPGLALFYGGLVRSKNVLQRPHAVLHLRGVVGVAWILFGYSLAFGTGNAFIGDLSKVGMAGSPSTP
jgi:Amt family ammonium transporter